MAKIDRADDGISPARRPGRFVASRRTVPLLSSRPWSAVISTFPRCHLDREGEISCSNHQPQKTTSAMTTGDFSLRFEMTAGEASRPSPWREQQDL